ncbi:MAG: MFS transporter, partial [Chloroflexota bacterium]|nr:MFS transporter [Chloroflexota bacterium]
MAAISNALGSVRGLGRRQLTLLGSVTGGHAVIHWHQQLFPLIIPQVKAGLGLTDVEVGYFSAARQAAVGAANLPSGIIADAWYTRRAVMLGASLAFMAMAYFLVGIAPSLLWALPGAMLVGLGTAVWHPPAMASLSARFPGRRATALAMHGMGATFSDTLTPIAFGGLLVLFNWRGVLQAQMIPALLAALIVWRVLAGQFKDAPPAPQGGRFRDVGMLLRNPVFAGVSFAQGLMAMSRNVILTFLPLY